MQSAPSAQDAAPPPDEADGRSADEERDAALLAQDIEPCANETADRIATGIVTVVPVLALGLVVWQAWASFLHWHDFVVFAVMYVITGLGITVGFHRHFTHRAFATSKPVRATLAVMGTMAIEGPITAWVADHRKHHAFSDQEGDPHSPHVDHGHGLRGALKGLAHAHVGWLFLHTQRGNKRRYAPDLIADTTIRFIDRTTLWWIGLGLALPFGARLRARRDRRGRAHRPAVGRRGAHRPAAPRDVLDQLAVSLLRPAALRDRRRVAQPHVARAAVLRRGVAQQPPRVPDVGRARDALVRAGAGPERDRHRDAGTARPRVGRRDHLQRAPGGEARRARGR